MAPRKISRKQLLKEPDEFISFSARMIEYFQQHKNAVIGGAVAFLLALVLAVGIRSYINNQEKKAFVLLAGINQTYAETLNTKGPQAALEVVQSQLRALLDDYGNRTAGRLGTYLLGAALLEAGHVDEAVVNYRRALDHLEAYPGFREIILSGLGHAYEKKQDWEKAISFFKQIRESENDLMKDMALFQLGRLYQAAGRQAEGKMAFQELVNKYPNSLYAGPAREKAADQL